MENSVGKMSGAGEHSLVLLTDTFSYGMIPSVERAGVASASSPRVALASLQRYCGLQIFMFDC